MNCTDAMAALLSMIERGGSLPDDVREHLKQCGHCSALLASAKQLQTSLAEEAKPEAADVEAAAKRAAEELRREQQWTWTKRIIAGAFAAVVFGFLLLIPFLDKDLDRNMALLVGLTGFAIALLFSVPLLALMRTARTQHLYKRLGPGRQLSGVCLGLAEATHWPVTVFRVLFVALIFVKGLGFLLYLLFILAMPVHPDDRQYLLRFKLRRMFYSSRSGGHARN